MRRPLVESPVDPELALGAYNAVRVCLQVQPSEKVTLITDEASQEIAASLVHEIEAVGAPYRLWGLEEMAERPLDAMPQPILADLESSQVSIFAAQAERGELRSRMQM